MQRTTLATAARSGIGIVCLIAATVSMTAHQAAQQPQTPTALTLLEQYERGDYGDVERALQSVVDPKAPLGRQQILDRYSRLAREVESVLPAWIGAGDAATRDRRRRMAAGFVLEGAGVYMTRGAFLPPSLEWLNIGLRARQADPNLDFDRRWYLAALSVVETAKEPDLTEQFVKHAAAAVPDEPVFDLALAVAAERRWPDRGLALWKNPNAKATAPHAPLVMEVLPYRAPGSLPRYSPSSPEAGLTAARQALERVRQHDSVRAEATLRLGRVLSRLHANDSALATLREVPRLTSDLELIHLSHLFRGEIYERGGRTNDAIGAYREALAVVPHGRTANLTLAPLLLKSGDRQAADELTRAGTAARTDLDPWFHYLTGMPHWTSRIARVREMLNQIP